MNIRLVALFGWIALVSPQAYGQVNWTRAWADPPRKTLRCVDDGEIFDRQTRADVIARNPGLAGNVERITQLMLQRRTAGYSGDENAVSIRLRYRLVYTSPLAFDARAGNRGMRSGVFRGTGGALEDFYNKEDAVALLSPDKAARLDKIKQQFFNAREAEIAYVLRWHDKQHAWRQDELDQIRTRTDGVFERPLPYPFCALPGKPPQQHSTMFQAKWQSIGASKKSKR